MLCKDDSEGLFYDNIYIYKGVRLPGVKVQSASHPLWGKVLVHCQGASFQRPIYDVSTEEGKGSLIIHLFGTKDPVSTLNCVPGRLAEKVLVLVPH